MDYLPIRFLINHLDLIPDVTKYINYLYYKSDKIKLALGLHKTALVINDVGYYENQKLPIANVKTIKFKEEIMFILTNNGDLYQDLILVEKNIKEIHCRSDRVVVLTFENEVRFLLSTSRVMGVYQDSIQIINTYSNNHYTFNVQIDKVYCKRNLFGVRTVDKKVYRLGSGSKLILEDVDKLTTLQYGFIVKWENNLTYNGNKIKKNICNDKLAFIDDQNTFYVIGRETLYQHPKLVKTFRYVNNRILILNIYNSIEIINF